MRKSAPTKRRRNPLAEELIAFFGYHTRRLSLRLFGIALIAFGAFAYISLLFYDADHTSWNRISSIGLNTSKFGEPSAIIADLLYQSFGVCGWLLPIVLIAWGCRFLFYRPFQSPKRRIFSLLLSFIFLCFGAMIIPTLKSATGQVAQNLLISSLAFFDLISLQSIILYTAKTVALILGFWLYFYAIAVPRTWWSKLFTLASSAFWFVVGLLSSVLSKKASSRRPSHRQQPHLEEEELWEDEQEAAFDVDMANNDQEDMDPEAHSLTPGRKPVVRKSIATMETQEHKPVKKIRVGDFHLPSPDLIEKAPKQKDKALSDAELQERAEMLHNTLEDFGVRGNITQVNPGPVVTLYEFKPAPGIKTSRVVALADDIARSMSARSARVAVIPGKNALGIELPNQTKQTVYFRPLITSKEYEHTHDKLPLILGRDIGGAPFVTDLSKMPHLLIAGTTGSGKSVAVNTMILSLLYHLTPEQCKFIMVDPKMLELSVYEGIPHLLTPVVTNPKKAVVALKWAVREMEERYQRMSKLGVRNILGYNQKIEEAAAKGEVLTRRVQTGYDPETGKPQFEEVPIDMSPLPYIVVIVDEMADLMLVAGKEIEAAIQRLAQMARAAGIHLIMATQRPSVDVITGTIKANFPTRISFQVSSKIDSRTILGEPGAEQLLGQGDMLFMEGGGRIRRLHGPFVSDGNIEKIVRFLSEQEAPAYIEDVTRDEEESASGGGNQDREKDPLFDQAVALIVQEKKASTSFIQRHFQIGYNRAARIIDQMEAEGIVSAANHVGRREILAR